MPLYGVSYPLLPPDGSASAPSYAFASAPTTGFYIGSGAPSISIAGVIRYQFGGGTFLLTGGVQAISLFGDTVITRDAAANTLAMRNGTSAQTFRVYNTYTDGSNYERGRFEWVSNILNIGSEAAGTGTLRNVRVLGNTVTFRTSGTDRWYIGSGGELGASTDNTYDIGASGATRPRNVYVGTDVISGNSLQTSGAVVAGQTSSYRFSNSSRITNSSDGVIKLSNDAVTDFSRLQFGGTTSSFPALARSGSALQVQLADGSARAAFEAAAIGSNSSITASSSVTAQNGTAIPAGGTAGAGFRFSSTANFGVFFGSGAPTLSAAQGSLYLRSDGSGTGDRLYVNTDGSTAWTAVTTAT